ncbi:MAG: nucleotidyltransferase domain-containing protein [Nitrospirae bacterium]|nr:nucleotidyltransferase domain-containing protein [Nitrospirota bacterium]
MNTLEKKILETFKTLLLKRVLLYKMILFGSRARGDASPYSDMDVLVILDTPSGEQDIDYVSDCAWEAGFEHGIVVVPVVFSKEEWENSPERYSLLAQAVEMEGVSI